MLHKESLMCPCEASDGQHFGCGVCQSSRGDSLSSSVQSRSGSVGRALSQGLFLSAEHVSGGLNISANCWQSRSFHDSSNWKLCLQHSPRMLFNRIGRTRGTMPFLPEGICADASKLILAAWRPGTNAIYNSSWEKWHRWCVTRESDSFRPILADITSFLSDYFNEGLEYRTLKTYRSALSSVLPQIDGFR